MASARYWSEVKSTKSSHTDSWEITFIWWMISRVGITLHDSINYTRPKTTVSRSRWAANNAGRQMEKRWHRRYRRGEWWAISREKAGDVDRKCEECAADREEMRGAVDGWIMNDVISKNIRLQGNRQVWVYWKAKSVTVWCHQMEAESQVGQI